MRDVNLNPHENPIQLIKQSLDGGASIAKNPLLDPKGTFNGFNVNDPIKNRIDYIFTKNLSVEKYIHINQQLANGKHISDHLPVFVSLLIN